LPRDWQRRWRGHPQAAAATTALEDLAQDVALAKAIETVDRKCFCARGKKGVAAVLRGDELAVAENPSRP
jgi:hypothetical protein